MPHHTAATPLPPSGPQATHQAELLHVLAFDTLCCVGFGTQADIHEECAHQNTRKFPKWQVHTATLRDKMWILRAYAPWTSRRDVQLVGVPREERVYDVLNVAWADRLAQQNGAVDDTTLRSGLYVDLG